MPVTRTAKRAVTTYAESVDDSQTAQADVSQSSSTSPRSSSSATPLFPASAAPSPRRPSHHKKRPASHIPRPPNAFILFRANFIRDRHLQASTDGPLSNVSPTALSTIVGMTWKNLPDEERQIWVEKARVAREEHKILHPTYRYQPLPTAEERALNRENKRRIKDENVVRPDVERCSLISNLLMQGLRGSELEEKVAEFDRTRPAPPQNSRVPPSLRLALPLTRSTSLPTPPRRQVARRPRASSTASSPGATAVGPSITQTPVLTGSPYLLSPGSYHAGVGHSGLGYSESGMPELTYDPASPSSINLPEPQDGDYLPSMHTVDPSTYQHPRSNLSSRVSAQSFNRTSPSVAPTTNPFTSYSPWDETPQTANQYHHFPYFTPTHEPAMTADPHAAFSSTIGTIDPYASSVPPFQLYVELKPFEQSIHGFSTNPRPANAFPHALASRYDAI